MSIQRKQKIWHEIRKLIFNVVKRHPRMLDTVSISIVILFNAILIYVLGLGDSELLPPYFLSLFFIFVFMGRRVELEKVMKDLLREGDVIAFFTGGDELHFGHVASFVQKEESERLGLRPGQEYVAVTDKTGTNRILPVSNIGMIK